MHVHQGSLIRHGWTISFNPKIVAVQNYSNSDAGPARVEQVYARLQGGLLERQSHRVTTKVLRDTVFANRLIGSHGRDFVDAPPVAAPKPARRGAELPMVPRQRRKSSHQPQVPPHFPDPPQASMVYAPARTRRKASPLATILQTVSTTKAGEARPAFWRRHPRAYQAVPLSEAQTNSASKPPTPFQPMRLDWRAPDFPMVSKSTAKRIATLSSAQPTRPANRSVPPTYRKPRPSIEQVWLKAAEAPKSFVDAAPNHHFAQSRTPLATLAQTIVPQSVLPPPSPQLPDMNRLVNEVVSRIERTARNEQLRRGL